MTAAEALESEFGALPRLMVVEPPEPGAPAATEPPERYTVIVLFKSGARERFEVGEFEATHRGGTLTGYRYEDASPDYRPLFLNIEDISAVFTSKNRA